MKKRPKNYLGLLVAIALTAIHAWGADGPLPAVSESQSRIGNVNGSLINGAVANYPAPLGVPASDRFKVELRDNNQTDWQPVFVYQSRSSVNKAQSASWVSFSFSGQVELRITPLQDASDSVVIRPKAFQLMPVVKQGQAHVSLNQPRKLSVEFNGSADHPLYIFANPLETPPKKEVGRELVVFNAGIHNIGDCYPLRSHTTYYLQGGAVLQGSFYGPGKLEDVTICGRGILNSGYQKTQHPTKGLHSNISFEDGSNIRIEGITCIEAGNFQIKVQSKQPDARIDIENLKLIGWNGNTDGIHVSDMDWKDHPVVGNARGVSLRVSDCFIRANDDAILLCDGVARSEMSDCVIWDSGMGASFCLTWGGHQRVESCRVDRCYVIHKYGGNPVFRANHAGEALIRNVRFSDIFIEGDVGSLVGLKIMDHRYDPDPGHNSIEDIYFKNITVEGQPRNNFIQGLSEKFQIRRVTFENLRIGGKVILNPADMNLRINNFVSEVKFLP